MRKKRDELIAEALRICELYPKEWGASKGAELEELGVRHLSGRGYLERVHELLVEAVAIPSWDKTTYEQQLRIDVAKRSEDEVLGFWRYCRYVVGLAPKGAQEPLFEMKTFYSEHGVAEPERRG